MFAHLCRSFAISNSCTILLISNEETLRSDLVPYNSTSVFSAMAEKLKISKQSSGREMLRTVEMCRYYDIQTVRKSILITIRKGRFREESRSHWFLLISPCQDMLITNSYPRFGQLIHFWKHSVLFHVLVAGSVASSYLKSPTLSLYALSKPGPELVTKDF